MRQLATIQKITDIRPIENADKIEVAQVLGWECVVKKNEFKVNDLIVYIEIDSIVPERPEFEFLRDRRFKVKTIRLRKQISQGLVVPISILPKNISIEEGIDVTEMLDIKKYDKQLQDEQSECTFKSKSKALKFLMRYKLFRYIYFKLNSFDKGFPNWITKTDEDRIQVVAKLLRDNIDKSWYITEKIDGCSATFFLHRGIRWGFPYWQFGVCSRNIWLKKPTDNNYWNAVKKFDLERKLKKLKKEIVIQVECINTNIQKNKYNASEIDIYVFNIVENGRRVSLEDMKTYCVMLGLKHVPIIDDNFIPVSMAGWETRDIVKAMVDKSIGKSQLADINREGIVLRLNENPHISLKVINPEFLLKYDE